MLRYHAGMQDAIRVALTDHLDWLARLRWVSFAERALTYGVGIAIVLMFVVAGVLADAWAALLSAGGHKLLLLAVLTLVPRRLSTALLGAVLLSLLNFTVAATAQYASLTVIAWVYMVLGLLLLPFTAAAWLRLNRRWRAVGDYRVQVDFRWLLTAAPLSLRWRMHSAVRELHAESAN